MQCGLSMACLLVNLNENIIIILLDYGRLWPMDKSKKQWLGRKTLFKLMIFCIVNLTDIKLNLVVSQKVGMEWEALYVLGGHVYALLYMKLNNTNELVKKTILEWFIIIVILLWLITILYSSHKILLFVRTRQNPFAVFVRLSHNCFSKKSCNIRLIYLNKKKKFWTIWYRNNEIHLIVILK